jgi:Protein of unknown function (DUF2934)
MKDRNEEADRPLHKQIAALAQALWRERGCPQGCLEEDWFAAEHQITSKTEIVSYYRMSDEPALRRNRGSPEGHCHSARG